MSPKPSNKSVSHRNKCVLFCKGKTTVKSSVRPKTRHSLEEAENTNSLLSADRSSGTTIRRRDAERKKAWLDLSAVFRMNWQIEKQWLKKTNLAMLVMLQLPLTQTQFKAVAFYRSITAAVR